MICVDTTVLIDEYRAKGDLSASVNRKLLECGTQELIIPVVAAGEFLDGAAMVCNKRFIQALSLLKMRKVVDSNMEVAGHYARIVSELRKKKRLAGVSQNDLWIAATARCHGARLMTRNPAHFVNVPNLEVIGY